MNEFRASYNHFDRARQGLDHEELKSCLISVGYNIKPGREVGLTVLPGNIKMCQGDMEMHRILSILDPNHTNRVAFDAFLDFMTRETMDSDTVEQIIESFRVLAAGKVG